MKLLITAAALMLGSTAIAQTDQTMTTTGSGGTVAAGNTAPELDARGIPVVSADAVAPAGYNQPPTTFPAGTPPPTVAAPTPTAAGPMPPCTRTVTDHCTQTYERRSRR